MDSNTTNKETSPADIDIYRIIYAFKKSVPYFIIIFILGGFGAYLFLRWTKPKYEAKSLIKLNIKEDAGILGIKLGSGGGGKGNQLVGEIEIIKSDIIFQSLIQKLDVGISYFEKGNVLIDEHYGHPAFEVKIVKDSLNQVIYDQNIFLEFTAKDEYSVRIGDNILLEKKHFGDLLKVNNFSFRVFKTAHYNENYNGRELFFKVNSLSALRSMFFKGLNVTIENPVASTFSISFTGFNPSKAVEIVENVVAVYTEQSLKEKRKTQQQTIDFIDKQLDKANLQLREAEQNLENFIIQTGVINPELELGGIKQRIVEYKIAKEELLTQSTLLDEIYSFVRKNKSTEKYLPVIDEINNSQLSNSILTLNQLFKEFEMLKTTTKESTLVYKNKLLEINTIKESLLESVIQSQKIIQNQILDLNDQLTLLENEFSSLPSKETQITRLKRYFNLWEKFYLLLVNKKVEYGIAMAGTVPEFIVLSHASYPKTSIYPNNNIVYIGAIVLSLFLSLFVVTIYYFVLNVVMSRKDLERRLSPSILGEVPLYLKQKLNFSKLLITENPKSSLSESFRNIRTNLSYLTENKEKFMLSVTSTISGEGKTFVALNTAGVLSMSGKKVVILDLDMRKPKIHLAFGCSNDIGMSNLLIAQTELKECIQTTGTPNIDFIASGVTPPNPSELILRKEFTTVLNELQKLYDVVIIDTPPVGLVTDGLLVMKQVDIQLYIVKSNYSKLSAIKDINQLYSSGQLSNMSVVLNGVPKHSSKYGHGYGYYEDK